jgi:peptidoglycan L-alanyl-D-glutamate endopeptidase CwlK
MSDIVVPNERLDLLRRIDTTVIYPWFLEQLNAALNACAARGVFYVATSGNRSWKDQDALYAKGRDAAGNVIDEKQVVTNAKGGQSLHNYGIAVDFARHRGEWNGKLDPVWDGYDVLEEEVTKLGLESGRSWKLQGKGLKSDPPHVQLNLKKFGITLSQLRKEYLKGGLPVVFTFLDTFYLK